MTKLEAIFALMTEAASDKSTQAGLRVTIKALAVLDCTPDETRRILHRLDYCKGDGTPWNPKFAPLIAKLNLLEAVNG